MDYTNTQIAAIVYAVFSAFTMMFHLALVFGAPWGHLTLGGKYIGKLPGRTRVLSVLAFLILAVFAFIVLVRADLVLPQFHVASRFAIWLPALYMTIGLFLNSFSRSKPEKKLWVPIILIMLLSAVVVAMR